MLILKNLIDIINENVIIKVSIDDIEKELLELDINFTIFVKIIVEIEKNLNLEFPNEHLTMTHIHSIKNLYNIFYSIRFF